MKKTIKISVLLALMAAVLISLSGCGNTLTATKTMTQDTDGVDANVTLEVTFKNDKADQVKMTYDFNDQSVADNMGNGLKSVLPEGTTVNQNGKTVTVSLKYSDMKDAGLDTSEASSKADVTKSLKDEGFTVK